MSRFDVLVTGLPPRFRTWVPVVCLLLTAVSSWRYAGPYRWLAELQMQHMGHYSPKLSALGAFVLLVLPALAAVQLARLAGVVATATEHEAEERRVKEASQRAVIARYRFWVLALVLGLVPAAIGAHDVLDAEASMQLSQLSIAELEAGKRPRGSWLEVSGEFAEGPEGIGALTASTTGATTVYVPLFSPSHHDGDPIALVVSYREGEEDSLPTPPRGMLLYTGLPAPVQQLWRDRGAEPDHALLLQLGLNPQEKRKRSLWVLAVGLAILAGTAIAYTVKRLRNTQGA